MAHYDGMVDNEKINAQRAEIERLRREHAALQRHIKAERVRSRLMGICEGYDAGASTEVKDLESKFDEYGGPEEAYRELFAIHRLFDDEAGHPYEGDECLSSLVEQRINRIASLKRKLSAAEAALNKLRSYNVAILNDQINYRPADHIQVIDAAIDAAKTEVRPCTCHPSEAPVPCQHKYALTDCIEAAKTEVKS